MFYKIVADLIVFVHFIWILFMLYGFGRTVHASFIFYILRKQNGNSKLFFERWVFRTVHVCGILFVASLTILRRFCPLTIVENALRFQHDASHTYPGSFMVHYIERFVYPNVNPMLLMTGTIIVAVFTLVMFVVHPPAKIKHLL